MPDDLLDQIEHVARLVHGMRVERRRVLKTVRDRVGDRDGWVCRICDGPIDRNLPWRRGPRPDRAGPGLNDLYPSVEHVVPVSMGGTNDEANLAICHLGCNTRQGRDGHQAGNYNQVRAASAATQVLKAVVACRAAGWDPDDEELMLSLDVGTLVGFLRSAGRSSEVPEAVRAWVRAAKRRAAGQVYLWGTVERLERQAEQRRKRAEASDRSGAGLRTQT